MSDGTLVCEQSRDLRGVGQKREVQQRQIRLGIAS